MDNNLAVKEMAYQKHIPLWKVADKIGVHSITLTRWLRTELPDEKYQKLVNAIDEIAAEAGAGR